LDGGAPIDRIRASTQGPALYVLALGATSCAVAVLASSIHPGPRAWGLHLPGFLPPTARHTLIVALFGAAATLWLAAHRAGRAAPDAREAPRRRRKEGTARSLAWLAALLAYGAILYALRIRTHFLGDGIVWLNELIGGVAKPFGEPLATAAWMGFAGLLRALGQPVGETSLALLPVACGVAAAVIAWGIVRETVSKPADRRLALALCVTLGVSQLYFGYIESYPVVCVSILLFLWLAVRRVRGADPGWLAAAALGIAVATHLATMYLVPSYIVAVLHAERSWPRRLAYVAIPAGLAAAFLLAAGSTPADWLLPFRTAAHGLVAARAGTPLAHAYSWTSLTHAADVLNAILLAIPAPAILTTAWVVARKGRVWPRSGPHQVLAAAAAAGLLAAGTLSLPVAPAQDWDLTAVLLLPAGIAGIIAARSLTRTPLVGPALIVFSAASLVAFAGVNADEAAGVARYTTLIGPGSRVTPYGRGYGSSTLSEYFEDRANLTEALRFADLAIDAEPTNPRYWMRAGTILYNQGRYPEACAKLEEALRRGATRSGAQHNLGLCYFKLGRYEEAVSQLRSAVAIEGDRPDYRQSLGVAVFAAGYPDSARQVWAEILTRWPGYPPTARSMERHFAATAPR
jgi:hypothetical protein